VAADVIVTELSGCSGATIDQALRHRVEEELRILLKALHCLSSIYPIAGAFVYHQYATPHSSRTQVF
jgi:hypothetical protein